jgi:hypothetical protein
MTANPIRRELLIWADFNSRDEKSRITTSLRFAKNPTRPFEGESVVLHDDEGNSVKGVVEEIHDLIIHVRPEMATWTSADLVIDSHFATDRPFRAAPQGNRRINA